MTGKTEIAYSDNLCCAFMAAIVRAYESGIGEDHYLGRTAMQKLVYFAKTLGVPIPCSFEIYTYGPYSEAVTFSVESLLADDVIKDTSKRKKYSNYRLGENAQDLFEAYEEEIKPFENKIDRLVAALGKFKP